MAVELDALGNYYTTIGVLLHIDPKLWRAQLRNCRPVRYETRNRLGEPGCVR